MNQCAYFFTAYVRAPDDGQTRKQQGTDADVVLSCCRLAAPRRCWSNKQTSEQTKAKH